ncbi:MULTISPECIES: potassium-transporting ATPase subunit KdpC [Pantoea]|jgi:K+-transporting ATPase ATPase C chain|uniref:Potassium-transporting ATPase KdpC subunit n=1 Tax=Pantoea brenneri TaxID=472694 RepID=A0A7Y6NEM2_9GAMM|nr:MULTISPECIES: potassium-transporting ATPase subunit KdpC [Pantoea]MBZ6395789.1 potassium-transporting ATPase subunit KdpC [Pantoea sp.]MBZ6439044.1 potassium-transporting ATPase subunit KdpC [Pantoea sp.]MDU7868227.1 potassium-transporting ATPase subunit KdpC [Pantoea sp.]NUY42114.1 potassium-transporting ATPase subunit KdpC [Pantoea brenneri]NUY49739.1 potassium-transporting ATPase subunit KdpC [Pantoea brenneri]
MSQLRPAILLLLLLTVISGVVYPLLTTGLAQWLFPAQANGSLLEKQGVARGSALIGQNFTQPGYFWGRPSASGDRPYNPLASGGSNLAASNPALDKAVAERVAALRAANPQAPAAVPVELVTASASGLDPDISPDAARWQAPRIAASRQLPLAQVEALIDQQTHRPLMPFLGDPTVNVLQLNLALSHL